MSSRDWANPNWDAAFQAELAALEASFEEVRKRKLLRAMFYGDPGAGKTTLAAHLVQEKGLLLYADSAWQVIYKYPDLEKKITPQPFKTLGQVKAFAHAHSAGVEPYCNYDTLIWDPTSSAVDIVLRNLVDIKRAIIDWKKHQPDPDVEGWPHYRIAARLLLDTIIELNKSDLNVIYTSHIREPTKNDKEDRVVKKHAIRPDVPEACFKALHKEVLLLGYAYKESRGDKRLIQFEGTLTETAKSQMSTIDEKTYPINEIPDLVSKWRSEEKVA